MVKRKVFGIVVECIQSVCVHGVDKSDQSLLMLGMYPDNYIVHTCNFIPKEKKDDLKILMDSINMMKPEELKIFKKNLMTSGDNFFKNSIEIGLVDMAKRSGNAIEYDLQDVDGNTAFFSLKAKISKTKAV